MKNKILVVMGLGYVGLPVALKFSKKIKTIGFDISSKRVNELKSFRDINLSFKMHPITNDLMVLKNEDAIKRSVINIVNTIIGEKPFLNDFGSQINASLFELDTSLNYIAIQNQITSSLKQYETRITKNEV